MLALRRALSGFVFGFCRMNPPTKYRMDQVQDFSQKHIVGKIICIKYLHAQWKNFKSKQVLCAGWVRSVRVSNKMLFIDLLDGTSAESLQITVENTHPNWETFKSIKKGYSIKANGVVTSNNNKVTQGNAALKFQLVIGLEDGIQILGTCNPAEYILSAKNLKFETTREYLHLRSRTVKISSITRIRNTLAYDTHNFFQQNGFINLHTPIITTSDCEGAGEMFQVTTLLNGKGMTKPTQRNIDDYSKDFFKRQAFLTVSGQLAAEAFCCGMSKVYTFGPTFRAQVSNTTRHVAEFWMVEPELAFADMYDAMDLAEAYIKFCVRSLLKKNAVDFDFLENSGKREGLSNRIQQRMQKVQRISYTDAIAQLQKHNDRFRNKISWGCDLSTQHERYLCQNITNCPTFVYNYPSDIKPFYMRINQDGKTVASFDLLMPGVGEVIGGSQREQRLDVLLERMDKFGVNPKNYQWYLDLRRFGTVPHSGFGMGFDRLVMFCTQTDNIRDVVPFPRTPGNADC